MEEDSQVFRMTEVPERPLRPLRPRLDGSRVNDGAEVLHDILGIARVLPVGDPFMAHRITALRAAIIG
ncbi:MAG: hypothetical protein A3F92_09170 [Candidatus Rokubacteria bacterium RIFCSPLOWO2_12_FULL_71_22]|nr:MAG: hypothetical protein A3F92_09170 [Candidatus Rokubacteria bacterium RIFCSPLOWO2_12_FULL_71_22]